MNYDLFQWPKPKSGWTCLVTLYITGYNKTDYYKQWAIDSLLGGPEGSFCEYIGWSGDAGMLRLSLSWNIHLGNLQTQRKRQYTENSLCCRRQKWREWTDKALVWLMSPSKSSSAKFVCYAFFWSCFVIVFVTFLIFSFWVEILSMCYCILEILHFYTIR